jgi:hypothetical protein
MKLPSTWVGRPIIKVSNMPEESQVTTMARKRAMGLTTAVA